MAAAHPTARCAICSAAFTKTTSLHLYCSKYCYKRAGYLVKRGPFQLRACAGCGGRIPALTRKGDRADRQYCSTRCVKAADYVRRRSAISASAKARHAATHPRRHALCKGCGVRFLAKRVDSKFCTLACFWKWFDNTPKRQADMRTTRRKREATKRGASTAERVDPVVVFTRDGWRCQLCGAETPKSKMGKREPRAPTVDHIVPLSRGGAHSYQNTQCACLSCNLKKGARMIGQSRLF